MSQATSPSTGKAVWPGAGLPRVGHGALHRLLAAARAAEPGARGGPWALCG